MIIRTARASDAKAIAELHAESWRSTYRGILRDEFLDGPVVHDRQKLWETRFSQSPELANQLVLLIEQGKEIKGFACAFLDADPEWGALLDNLHVAVDSKGQGLGRKLISEVAGWVLRHRPRSRLHLWVYEKNTPARGFYERLGGILTQRHAEVAPDGNTVDSVRYGWLDLSSLAQCGNIIISTDNSKLDLGVIHQFLSQSYWSEGIPLEVVRKAIEHSLCFGVYDEDRQVGFARVITDFATFAYLADVFILESHRGRGLSKLLMREVMKHPDLQGLRRFSLATRDAHGLYRQFGFTELSRPDCQMEIVQPEIYKPRG